MNVNVNVKGECETLGSRQARTCRLILQHEMQIQFLPPNAGSAENLLNLEATKLWAATSSLSQTILFKPSSMLLSEWWINCQSTKSDKYDQLWQNMGKSEKVLQTTSFIFHFRDMEIGCCYVAALLIEDECSHHCHQNWSTYIIDESSKNII